MKQFPALLFVLTLSVSSCLTAMGQAESKAVVFPELKTEDLNGEALKIPADFPGDPTLILMAFDSKQQEAVDQWIEKLELKKKDEIAWVEMAVVGSKYRVMKGIIDKGMRKGITAEKDRARVITIYSSRNDLMAKIGLKEVDRIYALVVEQGGKIRKVIEGLPTDEKIAKVKAALASE